MAVIWKHIPKTWKIVLFISIFITIILLTWGFVLPPKGKIEQSVIQACFMIAFYPTLYSIFIIILRGINVHLDIKNGKIELNKCNPSKETTHETTNQEV